MENEYKSNYQFQKKMLCLHQQISEFEKLDIEHKRTKSATWLEIQVKGNLAIIHLNYNDVISDSTGNEISASGRWRTLY